MKIKLIIITILLALVLSGCTEEKVGCDRFKKDLRDDCNWCESNGGKYLPKSSFSVECVFLEKECPKCRNCFEIEEVKKNDVKKPKKLSIADWRNISSRRVKDVRVRVAPKVESNIESFENLMLLEINRKRHLYDANPLVINDLLNKSAIAKALIMNEAGRFSHNWIGYTDTFKAPKELKRANNESWGVLGENLACGYIEVEEIVNAWMASAGHKKNLLDTRFFEMGVASSSLVQKDGTTCLNVVLHLGG